MDGVTHPGVLVVLAGLLTTALALVGVYLLDRVDWNIMGWYADYVLPVGALMVGVTAASGYGVGSWKTGVKITGTLLVIVTVLLGGSYFAARYLEYRLAGGQDLVGDDGSPLGFWTYFDLVTRAIAWEDHGKLGQPLGAWGYALRALEVSGFVGGGVLVPVVLRRKPYCDGCQRYMRTRRLCVLPAGVSPSRNPFMGAEKKQERATAAQAAYTQALADVNALYEAATRGGDAAFHSTLEMCAPQAEQRQYKKLTGFVSVDLVHCRSCNDGRLTATYLELRGRNYVSRSLSQHPLARDRVAELAARG
jgi:hypothetical protein